MNLRDRVPDEALDATHDELLDMDDFPDEELATEEEFREHIGEVHESFEVYMGSILINRMFDDGHITLGEYLDLMDYVQKYERGLDATLM